VAVAGLDIGSRTTKVVVLDGGRVVESAIADTSHDPLAVAKRLLTDLSFERLVVTGYGRHMVGPRLGASEAVSEISAAARGAHHVHPGCRTVIDVGGQDTKVIALDFRGRLAKFAMNDRCAAGTGRFLEVMAVALALDPSEFASAALRASRAEKLSTMCAVFAESEVVSLIARGAARDEIALGVHQAVATRIAGLMAGVPIEGPILFVGGGALNPCLASLLGRATGDAIVVPSDPRVVAALGCALLTDRAMNEAG
jgi:(R)-2-hydroxyacyl-CoA dehydratese activating ATPase